MTAGHRGRLWIALLLMVAGLVLALDQLAGSRVHVDLTASFRRPHPAYHHDLRPSVRATMQWGARRYEVVTNSLGFRDGSTREVATTRGELRRFLLLGDSFTEGIGVTWAESFAGRLSQRLEGHVEILNAGVVGYSPKLYFLKLRHLLESVELQIDEVFVFIDMSDVPNEILYAQWEPSGPRDPSVQASPPPGLLARARQRSLVLRTFDSWRGANLADVEWNFHGMPFAEDLDVPALRDPAFDDGGHWTLAYKYARPGMAQAADNMAQLAKLCTEHGLPLTIVIHPWPANIAASELDHPQVRLWRSFAEEHGARFVDLFPVFIQPYDDVSATLSRYFIAGDVHWNQRGHKLVADQLTSWIAPGPSGVTEGGIR